MKRSSLFISMLLVGLLDACASKQSKPSPAATNPQAAQTPASATTARTQAQARNAVPQPVQRWLELNTQLGDQLVAAKRDCKRVATTVKDFTTRNRAELAQVNRALVEWEQQASRGAIDSFYTKARPHLDRRIDAAIMCDTNTAARAAFDDFLKVCGLDQR